MEFSLFCFVYVSSGRIADELQSICKEAVMD
jgi:hypothetical protein